MSTKRIVWWSAGTIVAILVGLQLLAYAHWRAAKRAQSINCLSNIKGMSLAARMWAGENGEVFAPSFLAMSNVLSSPKILHCPADHSRPRVSTWSDYSITNSSYEWLSPGATNDSQNRIIMRCPIHGHLGYADGTTFYDFYDVCR